MGYSYVFNPLAGAFDTVQDLQTVTAADTVFTPPTGAIAFSDAFTEASTTLLNAHTPNVGTSYSLVSSTGSATFSVYAATALKPTTTVANSGCLYVANTTLPASDMEVSIRIVTVATFDNTIGLVFRHKDSNNFYLLTVSSSYQATRLYKKVAGTWTDLGLMNSLIVGTNGDTWKARIVGSTIAVYRNDILLKLVTDTSISGSGLGGISAGTIGQNAIDDVSTIWQLDDFKVQNFSNGGSNELGINIVGSIYASNQVLGNGSFTTLKPAFSFSGDDDTGIYRSANNTIGFATAGTERMTIGTSLVTTTPFRTGDASASAPAYSFSNSTSSGMYYAAGQLYWSIFGNQKMRLTNTGQLALNGYSVSSNLSIACPKAVYNDGGEEGGFLTASNITGAYGGFYCPDASNSVSMYSLSDIDFLSGFYGDYTTSNMNFVVGGNNFLADAGNLTFSFVTATTSNGGNVSITAGNTSGTGATGGIVTIASGNNTGTSVYSKVSIQPNTGSIAVFGATGRAQATTGITGATVGGTGGTSITTTSTFDGYTIAQVVAALRQFGWLA